MLIVGLLLFVLEASPVPLIIDTDAGFDVDDVGVRCAFSRSFQRRKKSDVEWESLTQTSVTAAVHCLMLPLRVATVNCWLTKPCLFLPNHRQGCMYRQRPDGCWGSRHYRSWTYKRVRPWYWRHLHADALLRQRQRAIGCVQGTVGTEP